MLPWLFYQNKLAFLLLHHFTARKMQWILLVLSRNKNNNQL